VCSLLNPQILSVAPKHPEALRALGCMWLHQAQQPKKALPFLEQLAASQPKGTAACSEACELLGDCLL